MESQGKSGNTVIDVDGKNILYMPTSDAIKRREVNLDEISLFESTGVCFGRKARTYGYELSVKKRGKLARYF